MTVSYTGDVANGSSFGCFWKILYRWRGSVYKLIWRELIAYLFLYYIINVVYRWGLDDEQKTTFEKVKVYCRKNIESIPMSFVLGFYVTLIVKRWWDQYWILPMPDSLALYISASIQGQDERGRLLRRTIMRYTMLSYIICLQRISFRVKKRFPTMQHLVDTGLMTENEMKIYEKMDQKAKVLKFWMPVVWAANLVNRARLEGRINSDHMVQTIVTELSDFRRKLGRIMVFDNVSVPLVYTQVVTLAVYTYFLAALIGRQWVSPREQELLAIVYPGYNLDLYFPIFLSLQFIFYIGWLKVAETLINPFGEDDDDFELNWLIDRHIKVSYMVVDEMHEEHPELLKDQYWEQVVPEDLPYNIASERYRKTEPQGSTASLKVNPNESVYADLSSVKRHSAIPDDVYAEYESVAESPLADGRKTWLQRQLSRVESFRSTSSSSSLFGRNRANSAVNGGLGLGYHGHHRPSLYERLMNRRSSKEARHSSRGHHRPSSNSLSVPEKGFLPNSRPRVPTPDVTKESLSQQKNPHSPHLQITAASPPQASKFIGKYTNGDGLSSPTTNPAYGSHQPLYSKKSNNSNYPMHQPLPATPNGAIPSNTVTSLPSNTVQPTTSVTTTTPLQSSPSSSSPPPPPYDVTQSPSPTNAMILSTIAENDTSPYSTSSTNHTVNGGSVYPSSKSIFGRKPSPPPLDELPPIPTVTLSSPRSSAHSSLKSDHTGTFITTNTPTTLQRNGDRIPQHNFSVEPSFPPRSSMELHGRVNEGYETDEGEDGRRYMTIAEVNECKAELERKLVQPPANPLRQQQLPHFPPPQTLQTQRNPSDDLVPLPTQETMAVAPVPVRYGPSSIFRQDAVCIPDSEPNPNPITMATLAGGSSMTTTTITETALSGGEILASKTGSGGGLRLSEPEVDDGYHERVSYSEEDENDNSSNASKSSSPAKTNGKTENKEIIVQYTHGTTIPNSGSHSNLTVHDGSSVGGGPGDTLRSNASDSDISRISISSLDQQSLPAPTRQKPIRRRRNQNESGPASALTDEQDVSNNNNKDENSSIPDEVSASPGNKNSNLTKDQEVFV